MHNFPLDPTPNTLSFFVVYMSHHIEPWSVGNYLSGICDHLEIYFPEVRSNHLSPLVSKTLQGMKKLRSRPTRCKLPLSRDHLLCAQNSLLPSSSHNDVLFVTMLITGTCGLLRLGELAIPDDPQIQNSRKIIQQESVELLGEDGFTFSLPFHKADRTFEGNRVVIRPIWSLHMCAVFCRYLHSHNDLFPLHPDLWVTAEGYPPTRKWFMNRLRRLEPDSRWAGQSMRACGATALAEDGAAPHVIQ
ncbi:hypothetical protein GYMLUDRAFT_123778, partial [Collybiopsis luxurians FD-317 M1]